MEDFRYDDRLGKLICPAGNELYLNGRYESPTGYRAISYRAPRKACSGCHLRAKCMRNPEGRSRQVRLFYGRRPGSLTDAMKEKIDTPQGRRTYSKRLGIVEPVFGNIRAQKGMNRFHPARAQEGKHPVDALLPGPQYRKDRKLRNELCDGAIE